MEVQIGRDEYCTARKTPHRPMDGLRLIAAVLASPFFSVFHVFLHSCILLNYLTHHISREFELNVMDKESKSKRSTTGPSSGTGPERHGVKLKIGYRVVLDSLKSTAYNDKRGTIHSLPKPGQENGRMVWRFIGW